MSATSAGNAMILASAGTGKTFELSNRYIRLLVDGVHPKSILATTFTRKAAGEILDRIVLRLARAAVDPEVAVRTGAELERSETTQELFAGILGKLVSNLNNLQVETLDAFFARIARAFSLDMGMPPGWEVADEGQMEHLKRRAIRRSLTRRSTVSLVHDLARGEAKRGISRMVRQTVNDLYEIYRETFDQKTLDAWSRLQRMPLLTDEQIDQYVEVLRSVDVQGTERFCKTLDNDLQKIARRDWARFLETGISSKVSKNERVFNRAEIQPELFAPLRKIAEHALALNINQMVAQTRGAFEFLKTYHQEFLNLKISNALLEFDDVAYLAWRLFGRYSFSRLAWRLDQDIDHLLLDEFQDTSVQQWQVLRPLAKRVCVPDEHRSFFCVGDIKQAIYGWRGGVSEIFEAVKSEFDAHLDQQDTRNRSYRSSPVIIGVVNQIFQNMGQHKKLDDRKPLYQSWWDRFEPHETVKTELEGHATFENTSVSWQHFQQVASRIKQLASQHPEHSIGVLLRTNDAIAEMIFELGKAGVSASEEGGNPLTDSAAVNLALAALHLIDHPDDPVARFHVRHSPLAMMFQLAGDPVEGVDDPCRLASQKMRLKLVQRGYGDLLSEWSRVLEPQCTDREWFRLCQLIEKGYTVSVADHLRTTDFISWVERTRVADPSASQVRVMTIHKSKGLEFDIVVLPELDFDRGQPPRYVVGRDSPTSPVKLICHFMDEIKREWLPEEFQSAFDKTLERQIHEMLSMIYVSVTRARHALHMFAQPDVHRDHKKAAGLIMAALGIDYHPKKQTPGRILWQAGKSGWTSTSLAESEPTEPAQQIARSTTLTGQVEFAPTSQNRNLPWESPSSREGGEIVQLGRLLKLEDNRDARLRGSLIHACFEQVEWLEDGLPPESSLRETLLLVAGADTGNIQAAITDFRKMVRQPNTARLLRKEQFGADLFNSYDTYRVENERRFVVRTGGGVLNGSVDRLVLLSRHGKIVAADVVDFKTDVIPPGDIDALQERTEVYRPQLLSYRDAVAAIYELRREDVSTRLMFVAIDRQVPVG